MSLRTGCWSLRLHLLILNWDVTRSIEYCINIDLLLLVLDQFTHIHPYTVYIYIHTIFWGHEQGKQDRLLTYFDPFHSWSYAYAYYIYIIYIYIDIDIAM